MKVKVKKINLNSPLIFKNILVLKVGENDVNHIRKNIKNKFYKPIMKL